jgi:alpha-glucuronidase
VAAVRAAPGRGAGLVDERRYREILAQLEYQAGQAIVWRDAVSMWFLKASKIADAKGRVGNYPGRYEAESMTLQGYTVRSIAPAPEEDASGGKIVTCPAGATCSATMKYAGKPGWFTLHVEYFDLPTGVSHYRVFVGAQLIDEWSADLLLPSRRIDAGASTRRSIPGVALRPGDEIRIEGTPGGGEPAPLDYPEIVPEKM